MSPLALAALISGAFSLVAQLPPSIYPPDRSLPAEEYVALGVPAPDRTWGPHDYQRAVDVLTQLAAEEKALLPRFHSEFSGDVFRRFTAPDNLSILTTESFPIATRFGIGIELQATAKALLMVYLEPASENVVFDDELAELMGFLLAVTADVADSAEEFLESLPADDPKMDIRRQGLARLPRATSEMVAGVLASIAERDTYRLPARRRMALHVLASVPRLAAHQTDLQRQEVVRHLATLIREDADETVRRLLAETKAKLE